MGKHRGRHQDKREPKGCGFPEHVIYLSLSGSWDCSHSGTERAGATGGTLEAGYYRAVKAMRKFDKGVGSNENGISQLSPFASRPGDFQLQRHGLESSFIFGAPILFRRRRSSPEISGKCKFLLTLSGGNGLLSHSAFLQATQ
jgi:hypothetical protein